MSNPNPDSGYLAVGEIQIEYRSKLKLHAPSSSLSNNTDLVISGRGRTTNVDFLSRVLGQPHAFGSA
jgi:hypothetical protein